MTDNSSRPIPILQKLSLLKEYANKWQSLSIDKLNKDEEEPDRTIGPAWELAGGVLAQNQGNDIIEFIQLPSSSRGRARKAWTTHTAWPVRDFTMDPGQDLLVVVEGKGFAGHPTQG